MKTATLSSKGQIVLPSYLRKKLNLHTGDELLITETDEGILLKRKTIKKTKKIMDVAGSVKTSVKLSVEEMDELVNKHFSEK